MNLDELLRYAQDRVATAPVPHSLYAMTERRRAALEILITASICAMALLALNPPAATNLRFVPSGPGQRQMLAALQAEAAR